MRLQRYNKKIKVPNIRDYFFKKIVIIFSSSLFAWPPRGVH